MAPIDKTKVAIFPPYPVNTAGQLLFPVAPAPLMRASPLMLGGWLVPRPLQGEDLPPFDERGYLPPGCYRMTLSAFLRSHLIDGRYTRQPETWDRLQRGKLAWNAARLARQLFSVGVPSVHLVGSFLEDKGHPNDIDGWIEIDIFDLFYGTLIEELQRLPGGDIWGWTPEFQEPNPEEADKKRPRMWMRHRIEWKPYLVWYQSRLAHPVNARRPKMSVAEESEHADYLLNEMVHQVGITATEIAEALGIAEEKAQRLVDSKFDGEGRRYGPLMFTVLEHRMQKFRFMFVSSRDDLPHGVVQLIPD